MCSWKGCGYGAGQTVQFSHQTNCTDRIWSELVSQMKEERYRIPLLVYRTSLLFICIVTIVGLVMIGKFLHQNLSLYFNNSYFWLTYMSCLYCELNIFYIPFLFVCAFSDCFQLVTGDLFGCCSNIKQPCLGSIGQKQVLICNDILSSGQELVYTLFFKGIPFTLKISLELLLVRAMHQSANRWIESI